MSGKEELTDPARDWLLAILHFAITLERNDRANVMAMARELDRPGTGEVATTFAFFARTSFEFCNAIADKISMAGAKAMWSHEARGSL